MTARPGPSIFKGIGRSPAQPIAFSTIPGPARPIIFSKVLAQPGPAHHIGARPMRHELYMGRPDNYVDRPVDLMGRPIGRPTCCPVLECACANADEIFYVNHCFFVVFYPSGFCGTAAFGP